MDFQNIKITIHNSNENLQCRHDIPLHVMKKDMHALACLLTCMFFDMQSYEAPQPKKKQQQQQQSNKK
jgi:hypothetical protein